MNALDIRIKHMINDIDPEFRIPVLNALKYSDGTVVSFSEELVGQVWENPELPVQDILDKLLYDVA